MIGSDVDPQVWLQLSRSERSEFETSLDELLASGLGQEDRGPPARYRFSHSLAQSTIYQGLSELRRARLHHEVAQIIEAIDPGRLDELATHFSAGAAEADAAKAVASNHRAAEDAVRRLAPAVAARDLYATRALVEAGLVDFDDEATIALLLSIGQAERDAGDRQFRSTLIEASNLAVAVGDNRQLVAAALENRRAGYSVLHRTDQDRVRIVRDGEIR